MNNTLFKTSGALNDIDIIRRSYMIEPFNHEQAATVNENTQHHTTIGKRMGILRARAGDTHPRA